MASTLNTPAPKAVVIMTDLDELTELAKRVYRDTWHRTLNDPMRAAVTAILEAAYPVAATHDPDAGAWYFKLSDAQIVATHPIDGVHGVFIDVDRNARIVGIEVH